MQKILIIEDDLGISNSLKLYLENSSFIALIHNTWDRAIDKIKEVNPSLIILDINLPVKNGIEICKELRGFSNIPVVMLTARASENDKIIWLEIWADDYIAKPFSPRELLVRIKTILRRTESERTNKNMLIFNDIEIDLSKKIVNVWAKEISLTKNEYDILEKIIKEDGKVVTREILMTEVIWYDKYVYDRTLDTHIKNLRKKLWKDEIILTIRWEWYRLNK